MADKKPYDSIIDAFLDDREPDWKDLGLDEAHASGKEQLERSHQYVDTEFEDDIAEAASHHTPVPPSKSASQLAADRAADKEKVAPRVNAVKADWRKDARRDNEAYNTEMGDNDLLMDELTMSLDQAGKSSDLAENSADKKAITDAQVFKYVRDLLNQGMSPTKVAQKIEKLAELELFNKQTATDYLQRNAGLIGLAYLEPNTFMDKNSPTYERTAGAKPDLGGAACVAQKRAWDAAGIKPQAKSVKQVSACDGCTYFNKDARGKACNLYHLPVVGSTDELTQIVNHLTPGVPEKQKHAALIVLANGDGKRVQNPKVAEQTNIVKTADAKVRNQEKRASYDYSDVREATQSRHFESDHVSKMHQKGASLEQIYKWASEKFGDVDASIAFRGFVQSLKKNAKGKVVIAAADLKFLNHLGIRSESYEGGKKCASCDYHKQALMSSTPMIEEEEAAAQIMPCPNCDADPRFFTHDELGEVFCTSCGEVQPISQRELMMRHEGSKVGKRVDAKFAQRTASVTAGLLEEKQAGIIVTASKVRALHQAGHSLAKIYNGAANKVGSVEARKAVAGYIADFKKNPGKTAVSPEDRAFLEGKLGFKPEQVRMLDPQRRPVTQVVASVPDDAHILGYPGMEKQAGEKKATDGHAILAEFDLTGHAEMQDIDTSGPKRDDVQMNNTFNVEIE